MASPPKKQPERKGCYCRYCPDTEGVDDYKSGDVICPKCAVVLQSRTINWSPEWRTFEDSSYDGCRMGKVEFENDRGAEGQIGIELNGKKYVDECGKSRLGRIITKNTPDMMKFISLKKELNLLFHQLNIAERIKQSALNTANMLITKSIEKNRTFIYDRMAAAIVYEELIKANVPRLIRDIVRKQPKTNEKAVQNAMRQMHEILGTNAKIITDSMPYIDYGLNKLRESSNKVLRQKCYSINKDLSKYPHLRAATAQVKAAYCIVKAARAILLSLDYRRVASVLDIAPSKLKKLIDTP